MRNWIKSTLIVTVAVTATTLLTTRVVSGQYEDEKKDMEAEMAMWIKLATPGKEHARLAESAGTWHQKITHWGMPGADPEITEGTRQTEPILGGRFVVERVNGEPMMGMDEPFEGIGLYGFDNLSQKYIYIWADNMGTMILGGEGTSDESGKVVTYFSEFPGPDGNTYQMKSVANFERDGRHTYEMYNLMPDNTWSRMMEIVSTRK